jgi:chromosome segregation ATPase
MKLVKQGMSQQTEASQFPDPTQKISIGDSVYQGIKVLVNFSGEGSSEEDDLTLSRLSGGQKAVVAASLIFAIQDIEAAPFYIMDEFDSALDP